MLCAHNLVNCPTVIYWQGGFTKDEQKYYEEYRLSKKGKHLWIQKNKLDIIDRSLCPIYDISYFFDKSCCCRRYKHLPFQCEYNDNDTIASYVKGNYEFYDVEQIEEFIAWKRAYEIASLLENVDDAPYKIESFAIIKYCMDNYKDYNAYITEFLKGLSPPEEETNAMQEPIEEEISEIVSPLDEKEEEPIEEEISEIVSPLDEKEEESDEQKEEEWLYPCLPSNESNSLTHTLFDCPPCSTKEIECYDPIDSF